MAPSTDFDVLLKGNEQFRAFVNENHDNIWEDQAIEQKPPFMLIGCADSRVGEGTIFRSLPGVLFAQRNIANQFRSNDSNVQSALFFAVDELRVSHIIVMGHYNCGGCRAAMNPQPSLPLEYVNDWVEPIRLLYATSERQEIVQYRDSALAAQHAPFSGVKDLENTDNALPAVNALIEENVKANVRRIYQSQIIREHYARLGGGSDGGSNRQPVFIHGLVYDNQGGQIFDLRVSVGPPGVTIPTTPFPQVGA